MRMAEMGETEKRRIGGGGRRMVKSIKMAAAVLFLSVAAVAGDLVFFT